MYNERLARIAGVSLPFVAQTTTRMSWFVYVVRLSSELDRDQVMTELAKRGIPSRPYFSPIHLQPFYRELHSYREGEFPVTEKVAKAVLALPFYGGMEEEQIDRVCEGLAETLTQRRVRRG